jgi:hypothetical protein
MTTEVANQTIDPFSMTPEQATEKLAQMTTAYRNDQLVNPLHQKYADPAWRARLELGSPEVRAEFDQLVTARAAADPVQAAMTGMIPERASSDLRMMEHTASFLRDIGIRDEVVKQTLSADEVSRAEYDAVKNWKADALKNEEWTKKLLAGDREAQRQLVLANIVLTSQIRKDAA